MPDQRTVTATSTQPATIPPTLSPNLSTGPSAAPPQNPPPANNSNTSLPPAPGKSGATPEGRKSKTDRAQIQPGGPNAAQQQPAAQPPSPQQQAPPPQPATPQPTTADSVLSNFANGNRMEIEGLSDQYTKMFARANAVQSSLDTLRSRQAAQGLGMRQDWVEAYNLLVTYMQNAKQALNSSDPPAARAALAKAEHQLEVLEKATGR